MVPVPSSISTIHYTRVTANFQYVVVLVLSVKARFSLLANSQPSSTGNTSLIVQQNIGYHVTYTHIFNKRNLYPNSTSASSLQRQDSNLFWPYGHLLKDKLKYLVSDTIECFVALQFILFKWVTDFLPYHLSIHFLTTYSVSSLFNFGTC